MEYLGNQVGRWDMHDPLNPGRQCWAMSSDLYVKCAVGEVENKELGEQGTPATETPIQSINAIVGML